MAGGTIIRMIVHRIGEAYMNGYLHIYWGKKERTVNSMLSREKQAVGYGGSYRNWILSVA